MELRTPHKTQSYLFYRTKIQIWEWGREILRRRGLMKSNIQTYARCLILLSLSVPLFCFLSMSLICVCTCSLFVSLPSFFSLFFLTCLPLFIERLQRSYRETPKKLFPYFSLNWSDHGAVFINFSSTTPNFMLSRDPLFSFFLFSLFRCFFLTPAF